MSINSTETPEATAPADPDIQETLKQSLKAILLAHKLGDARQNYSQQIELKNHLDGGKTLALFVALTGNCISCELGVVDATTEDTFKPHLLKLQGEVLAAVAKAEDVKVVNLRKLN